MNTIKLISVALALTLSTGAFAAVADCCADLACCRHGADCCDKGDGARHDHGGAMPGMK